METILEIDWSLEPDFGFGSLWSLGQIHMSSDDYDDPKREAQWLAEQRARVERYLKGESLLYSSVASEPAWFLAPYVSIWTVESTSASGAIGWWLISGDLPTDYLIGNDARDARGALAAFAVRWREASGYMLRDQDCPGFRVGGPWNRRELGDLLRRRAEILADWANEDEMWENPAD